MDRCTKSAMIAEGVDYLALVAGRRGQPAGGHGDGGLGVRRPTSAPLTIHKFGVMSRTLRITAGEDFAPEDDLAIDAVDRETIGVFNDVARYEQ